LEIQASAAEEVRQTLRRFKIQLRIVGALTLREVRGRFGSARLGYAWAIVEPIAHIVILTAVFTAMVRHSPIGTTFSVFFMTGVIPYFFFSKTASKLSGAITANRALLQLPGVTNLDVVFSRALLELATLLLILTFLLAGLSATGDLHVNTSLSPITIMFAIALAWGLGLGVGLINAVLNSMFPTWILIFQLLISPIYLLSGVFYMVERVPQPFGYWLRYNPLVHVICHFRSGFFPNYGTAVLDLKYLASWVLGSILIGLMLERALRRHVSVPSH
jgi:capsular polysaccharide transport system permease protein